MLADGSQHVGSLPGLSHSEMLPACHAHRAQLQGELQTQNPTSFVHGPSRPPPCSPQGTASRDDLIRMQVQPSNVGKLSSRWSKQCGNVAVCMTRLWMQVEFQGGPIPGLQLPQSTVRPALLSSCGSLEAPMATTAHPLPWPLERESPSFRTAASQKRTLFQKLLSNRGLTSP